MKKLIFMLAVFGFCGNALATEYVTLCGVLRYHELERDIFKKNGKVIELKPFNENMIIVKYKLD